MRLFFAILGLCALQACVVPVPIPVPTVPVAAENPGAEDAAGRALNAYRKANGLGPVYLNPTLAAAARKHSEEMRAMNNLTHYSADGARLITRARRAGYAMCLGTENIAEGYTDINKLMDAWYHSPEHKKNMLSSKATEYGYGAVGKWSTLILGGRC